MQAVILAAGLGSRLRPLTDDRPKAVVPLGGRTILDRALDALTAAGVKGVVVVTGYRPERVQACLDRRSDLRIRTVGNAAYAETNTLASLMCAAPLLDGDFLLLDGDLVFEPGVLDALAGPGSRLAVDRARPLDDDAVKVVLDGDQVRTVGKRLEPGQRAAGESIGIARIDAVTAQPLFAAGHAALAAGSQQAYYEAAFQALLDTGYRFEAADVTGLRWVEIDDHEDLHRAESLFAR